MNIKALLTSTLLVVAFAGTSAIASDDIGFDHFEFFNSNIKPTDVGYDVYKRYNEGKTSKAKAEVDAKKVNSQKEKVSGTY